MREKIQHTFITTPGVIERKWFVIDAQGQTLGRLASRVAPILRGKHKPYFAHNLDVGDYVIIINAGKIHVSGNRMDDKIYYRYSGYQSGLKEKTLRELIKKFPDRPIKFAIKGMLPKGVLGREMLGKLKVYAGSDHPHEAQLPEKLEF
jgi:large subunit ribosomal protein L13